VFKIKLKELINDIHKNPIPGRTITGIYVVEFQKRGLPHAHILIFFTLFEDALKDRALYEIDQVHMRDGHCLEDFPTFPKSNYIPSVHGGN
jgi:hypothetical protein